MKTAASRLKRARRLGMPVPATGDHGLHLAGSLSALAAAGALTVTVAGAAQAAPAGTILSPGTVPRGASVVQGIDSITTNATASGNRMLIRQRQRNAIINWQQFNIGRGSEVVFSQPDSGARALNRILDADPSIIQGKLTANGQVFLLNRNGILFDRGAQINVGTLLASTLNLRDEDFLSGFAAGAAPGDTNSFAKFEAVGPDGEHYVPGPIVVGLHGPSEGASAATLNAMQEGSIILIAPSVSNHGIISAPDGQVILAAGHKAYLWQRNTENTSDPKAASIRGLMVEITAGDGPLNVTNVVNNLGEISADRGNISIAALAINQRGCISAGSSVVRNGSVWLAARSVPEPSGPKFADSDVTRTVDGTGTVWLAPGSFTGTPLLVDSGRLSESDGYGDFSATTVNADNSTQTYTTDFRSWVHVVGNKIHHQGTILAPGGTVDLLAVGAASRILLDDGSLVSAAGNWVDREMVDNVVEIARLTSNDLQDAPLQRDGPLRGEQVFFDVRKGSPLFDASKYINNLQRTVQDKATAGGDVRLEARQGEVIAKAGSVVDVSGGGFRYADGSFTTTKLLAADGKVYDVGEASPLRNYVGIAGPLTRRYIKPGPTGWSVTRQFASRFDASPTFESAYVEGRPGGNLTVVAPQIATLGEWRGGVTLGRYQVEDSDRSAVPRAGSLNLGDPSGVNALGKDYVLDRVIFGRRPDLPSDFGLETTLPWEASPGGAILDGDQYRFSGLQREVFEYTGFGALNLYVNESVTVPAGVKLEFAPGAAFAVKTNPERIDALVKVEGGRDGMEGGAITAPAGTIRFDSAQVVIGGAQRLGDGSVVAQGAHLDVSGVVTAAARPADQLGATGGFTARGAASIDEYVKSNFAALLDGMAGGTSGVPEAAPAPRFAISGAGGAAIDIKGAAVRIDPGATLSAMGGFHLASNNTLQVGNGGEISISYDVPAALNGMQSSPRALDWNLLGYALGTGGKLRIRSSAIRVGGSPGVALAAADDVGGALELAPEFFRTGGVSDFRLTGRDAMEILPGTVVEPAARSLDVRVAAVRRGPGKEGASFAVDPERAGGAGVNASVTGGVGENSVAADLNLREKPTGERPATSVHFIFDAPEEPRSNRLLLGEGALVRTDPEATVEFSVKGAGLQFDSGIDILGSVYAPGGTIRLSGDFPKLESVVGSERFDPANPDGDTQSGVLHVGASALLSTAGTFVRRQGGGTGLVPVRDPNGNIGVRERVQGRVTDGGQIVLNADRGRLLIDPGSRLDVSAASAQIDLPIDASRRDVAPAEIWSDAGSISVSGSESSRIAGTMLATAAGAGLGGSFELSFARRLAGDPDRDRPDFDHRIVVSRADPDASSRRDAAESGAPYVTARVSAESLERAGFGSVRLESDHSVEFSGSVHLATEHSLTLDTPIIDVRAAPASMGESTDVRLSARRIAFVNSFGNPPTAGRYVDTPLAVRPIATGPLGAGSLRADANLIDLMGTVTVRGLRGGGGANGDAARASLVLNSEGDIRLTGLPVLTGTNGNPDRRVDALIGGLNTAGNIELRAQQVYPTTLSAFTVSSNMVAGGTSSPSGTVRVSQSAGTPEAVLSAGGTLRLEGREVVQTGSLRAPLGRIEVFGEEVTLAAGSQTSVAATGLVVPLGETINGREWVYALAPAASSGTVDRGLALSLQGPLGKQVLIEGAKVSIAPGASVDISGGSEVQAFEFVPGPGGSKDVLQTSVTRPTWAILPGTRLSIAPLDTHLASRSGSTVTRANGGYDTIHVVGVGGLADGDYPLLDAHYALLPGAFQVSAVSDASARDLPVGSVGRLPDGTAVISTYRGVAGGSEREARTAGYVIRPGQNALRESELRVSDSSFFADLALGADRAPPRLPHDAGSLTIAPSGDLQLNGTILARPLAGGKVANIDITAELLAVVSRAVDSDQPAPDFGEALADLRHRGVIGSDTRFVQIAAANLSGLEGSLLLGGVRGADGVLETRAKQVVVSNDAAAPLTAREILLSATDKVQLRRGAVVDGSSTGHSVTTQMRVAGDGAVLRAASGEQLVLSRSGVAGAGGDIDVQPGATLIGKSVLLDATRTMRLEGAVVQPAGGALSMAAGQVKLGQTEGVQNGGMVIDSARLRDYDTLSGLAIRSYSSIDLVGTMTLGSSTLDDLTLDAPRIAGWVSRDANGNQIAGSSQAALEAHFVTLANTTPGAQALGGMADGEGRLSVAADTLRLEAGDKLIEGFAEVVLHAAEGVLSQGRGSTKVAGAMTVLTPRVAAASGSDQALAAARGDGSDYFRLDLLGLGENVSRIADEWAAGGHLSIEGKRVNVGTALSAPAGRIDIAARGEKGTDNVVLLGGAQVSVAGVAKAFSDTGAYASAGKITLSAAAGGVEAQAGSLLELSAAAGGGDAGTLIVSAPAGRAVLAGEVSGKAGEGGLAGTARIDAAGLPDLKIINRVLNRGDMTEERRIRQRLGDLILVGEDTVQSRQVSLAADQGSVMIAGRIDSSSESGGGRVAVFARDDVLLSDGSEIDASGLAKGPGAADPYSPGGQVEIAVTEGSLSFASGASINVSAGAKGDAGSVTLAASRSSDGAMSPMAMAGTIVARSGAGGAPGQVIVRGDRRYDASDRALLAAGPTIGSGTSATFTDANPVWADYRRFMGRAASIKDDLRVNQPGGLSLVGASADSLSVRAGIEVFASPEAGLPTDLVLAEPWDLTSPDWNLGGTPGTLTLRGSGSLDIRNALGLPSDAPPFAQTWSLRMVGGGDMGAADVLALAPRSDLESAGGAGNVIVRDDGTGTNGVGRVRTGSGSIDIAAGLDFVMGSTSGNQAVVYTVGIPQEDLSDDPYRRYLAQGGDIRIVAQRNAIGSMTPTELDAFGGLIQAGTGEFINDWLRRTTLPLPSNDPRADSLRSGTAGWWVFLPKFRHNVGSFGGGDVSILAESDVRNLGAVSVSSGRANREMLGGGQPASVSPILGSDGQPMLVVRGGGDLIVAADEDVIGGEYLVSLGKGRIRAGGSVGAAGIPTGLFLMGLGSDLAKRGASLRVEATGDVTIQSISNPTILASSQPNYSGAGALLGLSPVGFGFHRSGFFTYDESSSVEVVSVTGDLRLGTATAVKPDGVNAGDPVEFQAPVAREWSSVAPPRLSLAALDGSVSFDYPADSRLSPLDLYSSETGRFIVVAAESVRDVSLRALNVAPGKLPQWNHPGTVVATDTGFGLNEALGARSQGDVFSASMPRIASAADGSGPQLIVEAQVGDLAGSALVLPSRSVVRAGRDIISVRFDLQNLSDQDQSLVVAKRDIVQDAARDRAQGESSPLRLDIAGPGSLVVQAGRNVDLGSSVGVVADGNTRNASLATNQSARIFLLVGVQGDVKAETIDAMLRAVALFGLMGSGDSAAMAREARVAIVAAQADGGTSGSLDALDQVFATQETAGRTKDLRSAATAARSALGSVRAAGGSPDLLASLLDGLDRLGAVDTADGEAVGREAAAAALSVSRVVFASNGVGPGTVDMFNSKLQTTGGSDINIVVPGFGAEGLPAGVVNAGLPSGSSGNLGILTQTGGAIRAFLSGDFNVNQSKVLTAQGGDIMLYTSDGSIDAGRGALSSRSSSPPRRIPLFGKDDEGRDVQIGYAFLPPIDVTGSGIRTVTSDPDGPGPRDAPPPGSVLLFAPKGTVDAGEAGISSAGDVTIRAVQVLNASAISAAGQSSGVPQVDSSTIGALGAGPTPGTTKTGDDPAKTIQNAASAAAKDAFRPSFLLVEVLGFGNCGEGDQLCR